MSVDCLAVSFQIYIELSREIWAGFSEGPGLGLDFEAQAPLLALSLQNFSIGGEHKEEESNLTFPSLILFAALAVTNIVFQLM